jgi:hypothetical protein
VAEQSVARVLPNGDSSEQRLAERILVAAFGVQVGVVLVPLRIVPPDGSYAFEVDGASDAVLCEVYAHLGRMKPAQEHKVMHDAAKLRYAERLLGSPRRKVLVFADATAAGPFLDKRWKGQALAADGIEIVVLALPADIREQVRLAQIRQFR